MIAVPDGDRHLESRAFRRAIFEDYGEFVTGLRGCYVAAEDSGVHVASYFHFSLFKRGRCSRLLPARRDLSFAFFACRFSPHCLPSRVGCRRMTWISFFRSHDSQLASRPSSEVPATPQFPLLQELQWVWREQSHSCTSKVSQQTRYVACLASAEVHAARLVFTCEWIQHRDQTSLHFWM